MKKEFNLFGVLEFLDQKAFQVREAFLDDPADLKELDKNAGWFLPQWMTGAMSDRDHSELILGFNQKANLGWYSLAKHPELQLKLLAGCGLGRKVKHKFYKPRANPTVDKLTELLRMFYQDIRGEEVESWTKLNSEDDATELANMAGYQKDQRDDVIKAYRAVKGA